MAAYKPTLLRLLNIPPYEVGRLTLQDWYLCRELADELIREHNRAR